MYFRVFSGKRDCFALLATTEKTSIELLRAFGPRNDQQKASLRARSFACEAVSLFTVLRLLRFARSDKVKGSLRGRSVFSEAVSFFNESRSAKRNPKAIVAPTLLASSLFHSPTQHRYGRFGVAPNTKENPQPLSFIPLPDREAYSSPRVFHHALKENQALPHKPGALQPPHRVFLHQSFRVPKDGMAVIPLRWKE